MAAPPALVFGTLLTGALVVDYGVRALRKGFSDAHAGSGGGGGGGGSPGAGGILKSLFQAGAHVNISRHDMGRDLEGPANTPVFAPGDGFLLRNGNDPAGFGISYPIVHFTTGPWAGLDVYFGHIRSLISGAFMAGSTIGELGDGTGPYVGNATGIPGHTEIGLAPGGVPGGAGAALPPGL